MEVRIYFESMEQAAHFVYPIVKKSFKDVPIKLVELKGNCDFYSKRLAPIIFWRDPDILISIVKDGEEYPLLIVEFSNAVFTEDHELQRFDGLVSAAENNCFYAKISPLEKTSPSEHGGNIDFDYVKQYALILHRFNQLFFHFNWRVDKKGLIITNEDFLSCPHRIEEFERLVKVILTSAVKLDSGFIEDAKKQLVKDDSFKEWYKKLADYKIKEDMEINTTRTKWIKAKKLLELKINRFGHAMDPERGMLSFYGILTNVVSKMLFSKENDAWYKGTPKESEIRSYIRKNGLKRAYNFLHCFTLGSGLHDNEDFAKIVKKYEDDETKTLDIDLTDFINKNFSEINKALRTIFKYSLSLILMDEEQKDRVRLVWKDVQSLKEFKGNPKVTSISKSKILDEDDVTYITIHNILKPNGFKIIAASYPGAQADRVILVSPGTGRRQERKYIDIIAWIQEKDITSLQENKGLFSKSDVQEDLNELSKYKNVAPYTEALRSFQERFELKSVKSIIKIGVGFWANAKFKIDDIKNLDLKDLDYFVYITSDMKAWKIWSTGNISIFKITEGKTNLPEFFEIEE